MSEKLRHAIVFSFQILLLLTPLIWTTSTSELFEFPKMLLVYAMTTLILGLWFARMAVTRTIIFTKTPLFLPLLLFLGSQMISTIFSIDLHTSVFGYYSRFNGGLLSIIAYICLYLAAVSNLNRDDAKKLIFSIVFAGIASSLYAFPEHFGHSPSCQLISGKFHAQCWVQDVQTRVFGTFGQPNWLAAYLISIIFLPLAKILEIRNKKVEIRSYLLYLISYILLFIVLLFTKSRSGLIGYGIGLIIFSLLNYKNNLNKLLISYFLILISFLIFGRGVSATTDKLFTLFSPPTTVRQPLTADTTPFNSLDINITPSSKIRQIVWKGAWELAKKYPLFGSGVETFAYSYYNVRPVEHNLVSEWDFLYNKAHNEFLNYAATTGFLGLAAYLFFLISYIVWSLKTTQLANYHTTKPFLAALLSGFIALCISNFFGFSTVPVQLLLYLFPALSYLLVTDRYPLITDSPHPSKLLLCILLASCFMLLYQVRTLYSADHAYTAGKAARQNRDYQTAVNKLQAAVKSLPSEALYTDEFALTTSEVAAGLAAVDKIDQASQAATIAVELTNRTLNLNKVHLNFYKTRAKIFINLSRVNPQYALEALASLDAAIRLSPNDAKLWLNRAMLTDQLGLHQDALALYQKTLALKPNYDLAKVQLADLEARLATQSAQ